MSNFTEKKTIYRNLSLIFLKYLKVGFMGNKKGGDALNCSSVVFEMHVTFENSIYFTSWPIILHSCCEIFSFKIYIY